MPEKRDFKKLNQNAISFRTAHYDKLKIMADKKGIKVSEVTRDIINLYFSLDFEKADLMLELVNETKRNLKKIEQFSNLADEVKRKFSSMNSAEGYYFKEINNKVDDLIGVMLNVFTNQKASETKPKETANDILKRITNQNG